MNIVRSLDFLALFAFGLSAYAGEDFSLPIYQHVSFYTGTNIWFVTESRIENSAGFQSDVPPYGKLWNDNLALNRARDPLDQLAVSAELTSLLSFASYEPEDFEGLLDDETIAQMQPTTWFASAAGLAAVSTLLAHLDARPGA